MNSRSDAATPVFEWPDGYGWNECLLGQIAKAEADRLTEILTEDIARIGDPNERQSALQAWIDLRARKDLFACVKAQEWLKELSALSDDE